MLIMGVMMFVVLFFKLFSLQIVRHEELQSLAVSQQTRSTVVTASRGTIYDASGNILAISSTAETVFLSPLELDAQLKDTEKPAKWTKTQLAETLAEILDISEESIYKKMERTYSQYEVLAFRVEEDIADKVREFINEYSVHGIYLATDAKRYYPYSDLAPHVIGFVGTDYTGLYGIEAEYETRLQGESGLVVTAKDNLENDMLFEYSQYFAPEHGENLELTLDATVQYYLQKGIEEMCDAFSPANGAAGVVLNVNSGAILGMASYPNYDLNDFATVTDQTLLEQIERGEITESQAQLTQWRNKCLNDTYEPGSTFKILTLAAALEEDVVDETTTVFCSGHTEVSGETIHCSSKEGHGQQTLMQSVGNSCNPAFITYGLRLGTDTFYDYLDSFGLHGTSGVDLGGEAQGVFAQKDAFTQLDLACYAFGQNFTVTPLNLIAAQAACVNGGYLYEPYLVEESRDSDGNVLYRHDATPIRQVISEETSAEVRECLEYVVSGGTGKNGQVAGYRIGGKTGTADKGQTGDVVVSFVCFAPADDPEIMMLITMDTPSRATNVYVSGGNMVAPYSSAIMAEILPYLGFEPSYSAEELLGIDTTVPSVVGMGLDEAKSKLTERGFGCRVVGDGDTVTDQTPVGGVLIPGKSTVIIYMGAEKPTDLCTVPNLVGMTPSEANAVMANSGLFLRFTGTTGRESGTVRVFSQETEHGTQLEAGSVITVRLGDTAVRD
ncbi:MAG: PASTA domain-containing protein [Oscillospiraceae bacterium]|nr:PASTA domain-containing protein [Oscillospiraceae bacterium]